MEKNKPKVDGNLTEKTLNLMDPNKNLMKKIPKVDRNLTLIETYQEEILNLTEKP